MDDVSVAGRVGPTGLSILCGCNSCGTELPSSVGWGQLANQVPLRFRILVRAGLAVAAVLRQFLDDRSFRLVQKAFFQ